MGKLIKAVLGLAVFAVVGLVIYGYVVDMTPASKPISQSVVLNGG